MDEELRSSRTTVQRLPDRARYDFETVAAILDAAFVCHVGFVVDGQPYVIPTSYGRSGRTLYLHGASMSRMLGELARGVPLCLTVTHVDGIVVARSGYHSSINYRSAVVLGSAEAVPDDEKAQALEVIVEHIVPGRWAQLRPVRNEELALTSVVKLEIVEASAKIRTGPPHDDDADYDRPIWAGVIPLEVSPGRPQADPLLAPGIALPGNLGHYRRPR